MSKLIREFHGRVSQCSTCFGPNAITVPKLSDAGVSAPRILLLGEQPDRAQQMGAQARAFVESNLTLSRLCDQHDRLYRRVVEQI